MPLSEQEKKLRKREQSRKRYKENIEKLRERGRIYNQNNREKIRERAKIYYQENKEKEKERYRNYNKTPAGIKSQRKAKWKKRGVIWNDFDELYKRYINATHCEMCNKEFTIMKDGWLDRCLEHNHTTGQVRSICCKACNSKMRDIDAKYEKLL